eukprot:4164824-Lingulodinium_polyedra.AAC.1
MGEEKIILYAGGGSSYLHPGSGIVASWDPSTDDRHYLNDLNLYFVDRMFAEKTNELFEWMARQGRIDGE